MFGKVAFEEINRFFGLAALLCLVSLFSISCGNDDSESSPIDYGTPGVKTYSISGTITGPESENVTVDLSGAEILTTTTNVDGYYFFDNLEDGEYTVTPVLSGYTFIDATETVVIAGNDGEGVNFSSSAVGEDRLPPMPSPSTWAQVPTATGPTTITMTATTAEDPSGGIKYRFLNTTTGEATTWQDSPTYTASNLTPDTEYEFAVCTRDASGNRGSYSESRTAVTLSDRVTTYTISGTVSGDVAEDVLIEISGANSRSTPTDSDGNYSFSGLDTGTYTLTPSLDGFTFTKESETVTVSDSNLGRVNFTSHTDGPIAFTRPERTILFVIDAMPAGLHQRIEMAELSELITEGVLFREVHVPLPDHPDEGPDYPWSCSLPNPVMMSGTVFIGQDGIKNALLQHSFTERPTCFYVNAKSYEAISHDYTHYEMVRPKYADRYKDELSVEAGKAGILEHNPAYIRIHCQGPGAAGHDGRTEDSIGKPYYENVWHPDSPFISQNQYVDELLGGFVDWLKKNDLWESSVLMVMGDHGEADAGGHDPYLPNTPLTQLIVAGGPVKKGMTYEYAENIDIAPTIAWLQDVPAPAFSDGRVLKEIIEGNPEPNHVNQRMKKLNDALLEYHEMDPGRHTPRFYTIEEIGIWHTSEHGTDYKAFVDYELQVIEQLRAP